MIYFGLADLFFNQRRYFHRLKQTPLPWKFILSIYAVSLIAAGLFYHLKPAGFPEGSLGAEMENHTFFFWLAAGLAGGILTAITAWLLWAILGAVAAPGATAAQILAVLLSSHVFYFPFFVFLFAAVAWESPALYKTSEVFFSFASLIFTVGGIRSVAKVTISKAMLAIFLSSLLVMGCLFGFYLAGFIPSNVLKAVLLI